MLAVYTVAASLCLLVSSPVPRTTSRTSAVHMVHTLEEKVATEALPVPMWQLTSTGLRFQDKSLGVGLAPESGTVVKLHYTVSFQSGQELGTSRPNKPLTFLLGKQDTKSQDRRWRQRWVEFGGKVEPEDSGPRTTALRELAEETSSCLGTVQLHPLCVWNAMCKFVLFFGEMTDPLPATLPTNAEISEYRFVDRDTLLRSLRTGELNNAEISYRTRSSLSGIKSWQLLRSL